MSQQAVNSEAVVRNRRADGTDESRTLRGELVVGVRVDAVPKGDADRLAAEGRFYPLTVDADGQLRVVLPEGTRVETAELAVLREIRDLLAESRDLLLRIA